MMQGVCFASDTWFYTDSDGAEYYLRRRSETRTWVGGHVIKVYPSGESTSLFYYYEWFHTTPYRIYLGDNPFHDDGIVEKGYLNSEYEYCNDHINPSVATLFEEYLGTYSIAGHHEAPPSRDS